MAIIRVYAPNQTIIEGIRKHPVACFDILMEVGDPLGTRFESLEGLVDTGSFYSIVPAEVLQRLGVTPIDRSAFELADGRVVEYDIGSTMIRLGGKSLPNMVVFGEAATEPLLGALTLETFRLTVDPVNQKLVPLPPF